MLSKALGNVCQRQLSLNPAIFKDRLRSATLTLKSSFKAYQSTNSASNSLKQLAKTLRYGGLSLGTGFCLLRGIRVAHCKSKPSSTRLAEATTKSTLYPLTWSDIWQIIKPYLHYLILATFGAIAVALLNIKLPMLLGDLVNAIAGILTKKPDAAFTDVNPIAGNLLLLYVAQAFFTFFYITALSIMGERMAADLRVKLVSKLLHHDMSFFDEQRTGELNDRCTNDVQEFKSSFKLCVAQGLRTFAQVSGCVASMFLISAKMTALTIGVVPLVILVGTACGAVLRQLSLSAQIQSSRAAGVAEEALQNIRTVKAFAMEDVEVSLYAQEVDKARVLSEKLGAGIGLFQAGTNVFLNGIVLGILYGGAQLMSTSDLSPGQLMSFLVTAQTIQKSLSQLSLVFGHAVKGWTSCARIVELLNLETVNIYGDKKIPFHSLFGEIELKNVSFAYPSRPEKKIFDNLNLKINAGQTIAFCGPSGAGKSTIISLIERLYEPQAGSVSLDGKDLRTLNPYWLRRNVIGIISQEPVLFATTIEENIRYGRPGATDAQVREAAELANAHEFIDGFPQKYKTLVGERGVTLSGGEKQRIAVARALLKDPPVLILDEATSALDQLNESKVQEALSRVMRNRTVIIIAHRLSTIRHADVICVVKDGKVWEQGNHENLMKTNGIYAAMVKMQAQEKQHQD
uniref:Mitochondrial potassium channel ATP-binding subunit n=1 Tax=Panagrellus redivivus TaxID=6233 RepID=A0A7E4ZVT6_PANRE